MTELFDLLENLYLGSISHKDYADYLSHVQNTKELLSTQQDIEVFIQRFIHIHNRQDYSDILFQDNYTFSFEVLNLLQVMLDSLHQDFYVEKTQLRLRVFVFQMLYYSDTFRPVDLICVWRTPTITEIFYKTVNEMYTALEILSDKGISQIYYQFTQKLLRKILSGIQIDDAIDAINVVIKTVNKLYIDRS